MVDDSASVGWTSLDGPLDRKYAVNHGNEYRDERDDENEFHILRLSTNLHAKGCNFGIDLYIEMFSNQQHNQER